jgi:hypothetical protein
VRGVTYETIPAFPFRGLRCSRAQPWSSCLSIGSLDRGILFSIGLWNNTLWFISAFPSFFCHLSDSRHSLPSFFHRLRPSLFYRFRSSLIWAFVPITFVILALELYRPGWPGLRLGPTTNLCCRSARSMSLRLEMHRAEICELYLVHRKPMKQVASIIQEKYGINAWYVFELP